MCFLYEMASRRKYVKPCFHSEPFSSYVLFHGDWTLWYTRQEVEPSKGKNHLYSSLQLFPGNTEILIWSYASEILLDQLFYFRVLTFDWTFNCTLIADVMSHAFNLIWKSCEFEVESTFILVPQTHPLTK